jgi:hypothetical protein
VQIFGRGREAGDPRQKGGGRHYIWFKGGQIRFGKLTMTDADLRLVDADPRDAFDFFPAKYNDQLVAGYSRNTRALGLETYMPDFNDLAHLEDARLPAPRIASR